MRRLAAALILSALFLPSPASADSAPPVSWHSEAIGVTRATGYRARVQVRPASAAPIVATFTWVGGRLSDGTFIQSGLEQPAESDGYVTTAFVWATPVGAAAPTAPLYIPLPAARTGDWYTFSATLDAGVWTFSMADPAGRTVVQQRYRSGLPLAIVEAEQENWMPSWGPIPTAAMRGVSVRVDGRWQAPHLQHGVSGAQCGTEGITATRGLNLVFRYRAGSSCFAGLS